MNYAAPVRDTPGGTFGLLSWRINLAVVVVLLALSALAWQSTVREANAMRMMVMGLGHIGVRASGEMSAGYFFAMWATMMAAMMLPPVVPMALAHLAIVRRRGEGVVATIAFVGSYLLVWAAVGIVPLAAYAALEQVSEGAAQSRWLPLLSGGIVIAAGIYQFTSWKHVCLARCQSPFAFIVTHDFGGGIRSALGAGAAHGAYCVGCCFALFSVLLVVGLMNVLWMVAIFLLVLFERNWKHGLVLARLAGAVLVALGVIVIARPAVLFLMSST